MKRLVIAVLVLATACGASDSGPDGGAKAACGHFINVERDLAAGVLTEPELRSKIKEVESDASVSEEPGIAESARRMLAAITPPVDVDGYQAAGAAFVAACNASVD